MRIYISADIEGVAGVVSEMQTEPDGVEWQEARQWMTREVCAAINGAQTAGAQEFVVSDSHGTGQNLLPDELPPHAELVRSWPRPLNMMQGIEHGSYDAVFLIGYHTGAHHLAGVLNHTMAGLLIHSVRINGRLYDETALSTAIAGHYNVPVVLATGDDSYCARLAEFLPSAQFATVKKTHGRFSARCLSPKAACEKIEDAAARALSEPLPAPFQIAGPLDLEVTFLRHIPAELLSYLPGFQRTDSNTIKVSLPDIISVANVLSFIVHVDYNDEK